MAEESEINRQIRNHVIFTYAKEALKNVNNSTSIDVLVVKIITRVGVIMIWLTVDFPNQI
jgi:hypothetical protein